MTDQVDGRDVMAEFVPASPMVRHLGIRIEALDQDAATLVLPFGEHVTTIGKTVHGGAIATLADTAAMVAAWSGTPAPDSMRGTTVDLTVHYLAPADGTDLVARARVLRRGRSLVHLGVDVSTPAGGPVAHALATYKLG